MFVMILTGLACCIPLCLFAQLGCANVKLSYLDAAKRGDTPMLEQLLLAGADSQLTDRDGNTALQLARVNSHHDTANYLAQLSKKRS